MPEESDRMSKYGFAVAYNREKTGPHHADLEPHSIDVEVMAPALLAFGKLIREANSEFNGKQATSRVIVVSEFEARCFHISFEVLLSLLDQVKTFFGATDVISAKAVLEWLGLIKAPAEIATKGTLTYLEFLRWKRGRRVTESKTLTDSDHAGTVKVWVEGDGNTVNVHNTVFNLSQNSKALRATRDAFLPLGQDGFDTLTLEDAGRTVERIDAKAVEEIVASCTAGIEEAKEPEEPDVQTTSAWLSVYSPVFDKAAPSWRFKLGTDTIYADISETTIAAEALARGGSNVEDAYQVRLEITTPIDAKGKEKQPQYKILKVIRFVPGKPMSHFYVRKRH